MHTSRLVALAATISNAFGAYQGFNYGSTFTTGAAKGQSDFEAEFKTAQGLAGTNGAFTSARLYTMVVCAAERYGRLYGTRNLANKAGHSKAAPPTTLSRPSPPP